ncbi:unnamed protein product [Adineta steineri]|uniref:Uncharacterized protein n=1 Tax=Adineta steineri TaxID=433720 RepID=A0A815JNL3_9BILA|nr:unnamed protein product [Adineta steineri]CAF1513237.1 unnamed protein product [Adineta steineri]CAF3884033.1 unnamed protein product [Adineta steineri]CAF4128151.1 unnamed protein product [Adineta steineri]
MSSKHGGNDTIVGYITNVSNENKKTKYFVKFTMSSENDEIVDGWVFSSISGIITTPLGLAMTNSLKNKTAIKLWGSIEKKNST